MCTIILTFQSLLWKLVLSVDSSVFALEMMDEMWRGGRRIQKWPHVPSVLFRQRWIPCMFSPKIRLSLSDWMMLFSGRTMGTGFVWQKQHLATAIYSLMNGPNWWGALILGEEQELVERDGEVENGGEDERASALRENTVEMATSTMPWHSSG